MKFLANLALGMMIKYVMEDIFLFYVMVGDIKTLSLNAYRI